MGETMTDRRQKNVLAAMDRRHAIAAITSSLLVIPGLTHAQLMQRRPVVGGHDARAQQRAAWRDRWVQRGVDEDAGLVEALPHQARLPVVADQHGDDRGDDVGTVRVTGRQLLGLEKPWTVDRSNST